MIRTASQYVGLVIAVLFALSAGGEPSDESRPSSSIDEKAVEIFKSMSGLLADQGSFHLEAYETLDVVDSAGRKRQYSAKRSLYVQRPDKMRGESSGDLGSMKAWYHRAGLTILDRSENVYMQAEVPPSIDEMLDYIADQFRLVLPLLEIASSNLYESIAPEIIAGEYLGIGLVDDLQCHHVAFTQEDIDWQIWVEEGDRPLLRKLIITYKSLPAQPQFTARIMLWEFDLMFIPEFFEAVIPDGAEEVPMLRSDAAGSHDIDENRQ